MPQRFAIAKHWTVLQRLAIIIQIVATLPVATIPLPITTPPITTPTTLPTMGGISLVRVRATSSLGLPSTKVQRPVRGLKRRNAVIGDRGVGTSWFSMGFKICFAWRGWLEAEFFDLLSHFSVFYNFVFCVWFVWFMLHDSPHHVARSDVTVPPLPPQLKNFVFSFKNILLVLYVMMTLWFIFIFWFYLFTPSAINLLSLLAIYITTIVVLSLGPRTVHVRFVPRTDTSCGLQEW